MSFAIRCNLLRVLSPSILTQVRLRGSMHVRQKIKTPFKKTHAEENREFLGIGRNLQQAFQTGEELESLQDEMQHEDPKRTRHQEKLSEEAHRKKILKKIIERKHFKPPQEVNLLSWDAKEQIRFLHAEYPDTWTVEQLAKSFPVTREGVIALLQSQWRPRSLKELLKHDKRVQKHWLALKEGGEKLESDGPLYLRYQHLVEEGKLALLAHAAGIAALPTPQQPTRLLLEDPSAPHIPTDGRFASIVKDYCQSKMNAKTSQSTVLSNKKQRELRDSNLKMIGEVIVSSLGKDKSLKAVEEDLVATYADVKMDKESKEEDLSEISLLDVDLEPPERSDSIIGAKKLKNVERFAIEDTGFAEEEELDVDDLPGLKEKGRFRHSMEKEKFYENLRYESGNEQ